MNATPSEKKTVLVFGTFDGLHDGHRHFLREARKLGGRLVVSVAQDSVIERFKGKPPRKPLAERMQTLEASGLVDQTLAGDVELGNWSAIQKYKPETIALGYDQRELEKKLREFISKENLPITIQKIAPLDGAHLHSRFLKKDFFQKE